MTEKVVLFDVVNTLVKEVKDESAFLAEAIKGIYGFSVEVKESDYDGVGFQEAVETILLRNNVDNDYIKSNLSRIMEELPYSYYNFAGHDPIVTIDGAKELLKALGGASLGLGLITGAAKGMVTNMFERSGIDSSQFKFEFYGNAGKTMSDIIKVAVESLSKEQKIGRESIFVVSSSQAVLSAAKTAGLTPIGVAVGKSSATDLSSAGAKIVVTSLGDKQSIMDAVK